MSTPTVLFVCVHNAGRSQMASALLAKHTEGRVSVLSAGSAPAEEVDASVIQVMREEGIDLSGLQPRLLDEAEVRMSDVVVTMGCGDACPVFPGRRYLDWELPDPAGLPVEEVRLIRERIDSLVRQLAADLLAS